MSKRSQKPNKAKPVKHPPQYAQLSQPLDELPPKPGRRKCLKCGEPFDSPDLVRNKLCSECNDDNADARSTRVCPSHLNVDGRIVPMTHEGD